MRMKMINKSDNDNDNKVVQIQRLSGQFVINTIIFL